MGRILAELGSWNWVALGLVLLALEIVVPGIFMLWFGLAAIVIGTITIMLGNVSFWPWEAQVIVFLALAIVLAYFGKRLTDRGNESDQPLLNQRGAQMFGRTAVLTEPVTEGFGRIQLDGVSWRVAGPDLPVGSRVKVISHTDGGTLAIEPS
jgi:membrane protein implicated in regulation of membrane protease activity